MRKAYITLLMIVAVMMAACSHIDEDEQLIYVKPAAVERCVLLEDFTGQRCVNCPMAADEIHKLQEQYGEDVVIAVSIHSGPLGFHTNPRFYGLATDLGDAYYTHWNLEYQPVGLINRGAPTEYTAWGTLIRQELQKTAPVEISLDLEVEDQTLNIQSLVRGVDGNSQGKLQVWIVEDNITAFQMMPDGTRNDNYVHSHVLRAAVNGDWGEDITVDEGYDTAKVYTFTLNDEWVKENLSVIAFVYNASGVLQVTKTKLLKNDSSEE